jgi:hypothetical protein
LQAGTAQTSIIHAFLLGSDAAGIPLKRPV